MFDVHNVVHFLAQQAKQNPQGAAVRAPVGRLSGGDIRYVERSFEELDAEVSATAHYFAKSGIYRGMRVLLMVRPGLHLIRVVFALFRMGAVPVVIDPGMGLRQFLHCVKHSRPEAIVGISTAIWVSRLFRSSFDNVTVKVMVDGRFDPNIKTFERKGNFPVVDSTEDELAAILFTSGSTGPAKGVCYTHGMFAAQIRSIRNHYKIDSGEIDLPMLPVFALFNPALGMCTVVPEMNPSRPATVNPEKIVRAIRQNAVTNSFGSPALWTRIARYCQANEITLPTIKRILMAGAPVSPELMRQMVVIVPNGEIHTPYGATEALPVSSISASEVLNETAKRTSQGAGTCVGVPLPGIQIRIVEPVTGPINSLANCVELSSGGIGEIVVQGPSVTRSYDRRPEADMNAKIFEDNRFWHRMGDLGWLDEFGRIWFCGRKVEHVVTTQGPLYTDCCEAIFNAHPQVFRSALIDVGNGCPAIVVEPEKGSFPNRKMQREAFMKSLQALAQAHVMTRQINTFFFEKSFPVDVRHNAKIHRLTLARKFGRS